MNCQINAQTSYRRKQLGQGMTEYIIIVALIAVAAIGIYGFFGDTIRAQMGTMTGALAGGSTGKATADAGRAAADAGAVKAAAEVAKNKNLGTFEK